jgi:hypothetical protein
MDLVKDLWWASDANLDVELRPVYIYGPGCVSVGGLAWFALGKGFCRLK